MRKDSTLRLAMSLAKPHSLEQRSDTLRGRSTGILIAVADRLVGRRLARMLSQKGYEEIRAVSSAARALVLEHEYSPGIIFLDLGLAEDAYDLARALQRQAGHDAHRLIALTPAVDHSTRERARRAGFERWLLTPVAQDEVDELFPAHEVLLSE